MPQGLPDWVSAGESAAAIVKAVWPHAWTNVEVKFSIDAIKLGFRCDDRGVGTFRVWVVDSNVEEIAYLEGKNKEGSEPDLGFNLRGFNKETLKAIFHMARCRRELERTGDISMAKNFAKYRQQVVELLSKSP
jgi:hypothetical protein